MKLIVNDNNDLEFNVGKLFRKETVYFTVIFGYLVFLLCTGKVTLQLYPDISSIVYGFSESDIKLSDAYNQIFSYFAVYQQQTTIDIPKWVVNLYQLKHLTQNGLFLPKTGALVIAVFIVTWLLKLIMRKATTIRIGNRKRTAKLEDNVLPKGKTKKDSKSSDVITVSHKDLLPLTDSLRKGRKSQMLKEIKS